MTFAILLSYDEIYTIFLKLPFTVCHTIMRPIISGQLIIAIVLNYELLNRFVLIVNSEERDGRHKRNLIGTREKL